MSQNDVSKAIAHFVNLVQSAHENQYGDFMRRVNAYLQRLEEGLGGVAHGSAPTRAKTIADIRQRLLFQPNFDIEATRRYVIEQARALGR